jgi:hypothetical protein
VRRPRAPVQGREQVPTPKQKNRAGAARRHGALQPPRNLHRRSQPRESRRRLRGRRGASFATCRFEAISREREIRGSPVRS